MIESLDQMKIVFEVILMTIMLVSCGSDQVEDKQNELSAEQIISESKRANAFFDRVFDAKVGRDPMQESQMGIKKDYDKWPDISDENANSELDITKANLDSLHSNFKLASLDEQTKISYRLFEDFANQAIQNFKWRFHDYPDPARTDALADQALVLGMVFPAPGQDERTTAQ